MFDIGPSPFDVNLVAFRIPIRVHWSFWLLMILLGWELRRPELIFLWVICGFISVLVHELGHALTAEWFGWPCHIIMYYMGGLALQERYRNNTPLRSMIVSAMGPGAGFLFYGVVVALRWTLIANRIGYNVYVKCVFDFLEFMNLYYGLFNLIPVLPLDGGHICSALCQQLRFRDPNGVTLKIGAIAAGAFAYYFFIIAHEQYAGMLMLILCVQSVFALQSRR